MARRRGPRTPVTPSKPGGPNRLVTPNRPFNWARLRARAYRLLWIGRARQKGGTVSTYPGPVSLGSLSSFLCPKGAGPIAPIAAPRDPPARASRARAGHAHRVRAPRLHAASRFRYRARRAPQYRIRCPRRRGGPVLLLARSAVFSRGGGTLVHAPARETGRRYHIARRIKRTGNSAGRSAVAGPGGKSAPAYRARYYFPVLSWLTGPSRYRYNGAARALASLRAIIRRRSD